jgi:hypothetical protein
LHNNDTQQSLLLFSFVSDQTFQLSKNQKMNFRTYDMNSAALYDTFLKLGSEESNIQVSCGYAYTVKLLSFVPIPMGRSHLHQSVPLSSKETKTRRRLLDLEEEIRSVFEAVFARTHFQENTLQFPVQLPSNLKDFLPEELTSMVVHVPLVCEGVKIQSRSYGVDGWKFCAHEQTIDLTSDEITVLFSVGGVDGGAHNHTVTGLLFNPIRNLFKSVSAGADFNISLTPSPYVLLNDLAGIGNAVKSLAVKGESLLHLDSLRFKTLVSTESLPSSCFSVSNQFFGVPLLIKTCEGHHLGSFSVGIFNNTQVSKQHNKNHL